MFTRTVKTYRVGTAEINVIHELPTLDLSRLDMAQVTTIIRFHWTDPKTSTHRHIDLSARGATWTQVAFPTQLLVRVARAKVKNLHWNDPFKELVEEEFVGWLHDHDQELVRLATTPPRCLVEKTAA